MNQDTNRYLPVQEYLPHRGRMLLLENVLEAEAMSVSCAVVLRLDSPFCRNGRVPAHVGVEYMAQTAGVLSGWQSLERGEPIKIGFLLSVRKFVSHIDSFAAGETLTVEAREILRDESGSMAVMACAVFRADNPQEAIMTAQLSVGAVNDTGAFLRQS